MLTLQQASKQIKALENKVASLEKSVSYLMEMSGLDGVSSWQENMDRVAKEMSEGKEAQSCV